MVTLNQITECRSPNAGFKLAVHDRFMLKRQLSSSPVIYYDIFSFCKTWTWAYLRSNDFNFTFSFIKQKASYAVPPLP
jgi:hypothetical protein